jgi:integrase/recombinase XerD
MALPLPEMLPDTLKAWWLRGLAAGHSERTLSSRRGTIRRLALDGLDPLAATADELETWLALLEGPDGMPLLRSSKATYRAHLRAWFGWLVESGRREDDPSVNLPSAKAPRGLPRPVSPVDVTAILAACSDGRARQTAAYVTLAAFAGLRVHEIAKIRGEDVHGGEIRVTGKGGVISTVPLVPVIERLAATMPAGGWWFPTDSRTGHVNRCSVSSAINRAMKRAGVVGTPHALRHFYVTQALRASGGDLRTTQRLARHASPATTAIYTQVLDETATRAAASIPGAA